MFSVLSLYVLSVLSLYVLSVLRLYVLSVLRLVSSEFLPHPKTYRTGELETVVSVNMNE